MLSDRPLKGRKAKIEDVNPLIIMLSDSGRDGRGGDRTNGRGTHYMYMPRPIYGGDIK